MPAKPGSRARTSTSTVAAYDAAQRPPLAAVCRKLRAEIARALPGAAARVWHGSPVWFVGETPVVGYNVAARVDVVLLFWNGRAFGDEALEPIGKFQAAQARYAGVADIRPAPLRRWLGQAGTHLWDVDEVRRARERAQRRR